MHVHLSVNSNYAPCEKFVVSNEYTHSILWYTGQFSGKV